MLRKQRAAKCDDITVSFVSVLAKINSLPMRFVLLGSCVLFPDQHQALPSVFSKLFFHKLICCLQNTLKSSYNI